jgi:hypothetical protein
MFSMQKIIVFALICAALWLGFRFVGAVARRQKMEERKAKPSLRERLRRSAGHGGPMRAREAAREPVAEVDMVACRVWGGGGWTTSPLPARVPAAARTAPTPRVLDPRRSAT